MRYIGIVYESLRHCVIGFALFVVGLAIPGWLVERPGVFWSVVCLPVTMAPFAWFAMKRGAVRFTWWDYLAWVALWLVANSVWAGVGHAWGRWEQRAFAAVGFCCSVWIYQTIRRRLVVSRGLDE